MNSTSSVRCSDYPVKHMFSDETTLKNHIFSISQEPQGKKEPDQQEPKGVSAGSDEKPVTPADGENNEGNDKQEEKAKAKHALEIKQAQVRLPGDGRVEKVIKY